MLDFSVKPVVDEYVGDADGVFSKIRQELFLKVNDAF